MWLFSQITYGLALVYINQRPVIAIGLKKWDVVKIAYSLKEEINFFYLFNYFASFDKTYFSILNYFNRGIFLLYPVPRFNELMAS